MKKNSLVFVLLFLLTSSVYSQVEWFPIGAEWRYEAGSNPLNPVYNHHFIVEKDTVVEGKACRLISSDKNTKNVVYEENGCVYYYFNDKFRKIYDFSVDVGDVIDLEFKVYTFSGRFDTTLIVPCYVDKVISKLVSGIELKEVHTSYSIHIELSPNDPIYQTGSFIYLEKVGCERPGLIAGEFIPHTGALAQIPEYYNKLKKYHDPSIDYVSNAPLYKSSDAIKVYPDPANDKLIISSEMEDVQNEVSIQIYDVAGRVVLVKKDFIPCELNTGHLVSGIYFIRIVNDTECLVSNKFIIK